MRRERFLIAVLWLSTLSLLALWFFNMVYGFNLLDAAHWRYLSELQLSNGVEEGFYISVAAFVVAGLTGLYVLIVPWHRRFKMRSSAIGFYPKRIEPEPADKGGDGPILTRPPKLNLDNAFIPRPAPMRTAAETQAPMPDAAPSEEASEVVAEIRRVLDQIGFVTKPTPSIGGVKLDFWAIGPDEALIVGLALDEPREEIIASEGGDSLWRAGKRSFKSPVWRLTSVVQRLEVLFMEILDPEMKIRIMPFVYVNGNVKNREEVQVVWNALNIQVFDDMATLVDLLGTGNPIELNDAQKGNFVAFSNFVDTVASYYGGGS
ncbi:MAG: hypothetical protein LBQ49_00705 [Rickettsiales bacterium]|jgi:hypothetical protein|nr:hypothetical protein [Rickettsiales bacterium]